LIVNTQIAKEWLNGQSHRNSNELSVVIAGVGGQGLIYLSKLIFDELERKYNKVISREERGFSKKRGSVAVYIRAGEEVLLPKSSTKKADIFIALEQHELLRNHEFVGDNTFCLVSDTIIYDSIGSPQDPEMLNKQIKELIICRGAKGVWVPLFKQIISTRIMDEKKASLMMKEVLLNLLGNQSAPTKLNFVEIE